MVITPQTIKSQSIMFHPLITREPRTQKRNYSAKRRCLLAVISPSTKQVYLTVNIHHSMLSDDEALRNIVQHLREKKKMKEFGYLPDLKLLCLKSRILVGNSLSKHKAQAHIQYEQLGYVVLSNKPKEFN